MSRSRARANVTNEVGESRAFGRRRAGATFGDLLNRDSRVVVTRGDGDAKGTAATFGKANARGKDEEGGRDDEEDYLTRQRMMKTRRSRARARRGEFVVVIPRRFAGFVAAGAIGSQVVDDVPFEGVGLDPEIGES